MDNKDSGFNNDTNDIFKTEADVYFETAEKLMEENNIFAPDYIITQKDAIRALVTSAIYGYSAELYLKYIISQFDEIPKRGHDLYRIYNMIQTKTCTEFLEATFAQYFEENDEFLKEGLPNILKEVQNNFIDHRYIAERVQSKKYFNIRLDYNYLICGYLNEMTDRWFEVKYKD